MVPGPACKPGGFSDALTMLPCAAVRRVGSPEWRWSGREAEVPARDHPALGIRLHRRAGEKRSTLLAARHCGTNGQIPSGSNGLPWQSCCSGFLYARWLDSPCPSQHLRTASLAGGTLKPRRSLAPRPVSGPRLLLTNLPPFSVQRGREMGYAFMLSKPSHGQGIAQLPSSVGQIGELSPDKAHFTRFCRALKLLPPALSFIPPSCPG